jgi:hypothetical protein
MPTITIEITVPTGAEIVVREEPDTAAEAASDRRSVEDIERYFRQYLSDNGRKLYAAAARIEEHRGVGYTLSDIAQNLSIDYPSAQSYHRTSGRSARRWKDDTGTQAPIELVDIAYDWVEGEQGMRTRYKLPPGVAAVIDNLT